MHKQIISVYAYNVHRQMHKHILMSFRNVRKSYFCVKSEKYTYYYLKNGFFLQSVTRSGLRGFFQLFFCSVIILLLLLLIKI